MKGHQMLAKLRNDRENEEGFTLIELLVVVIIIGILAAIAIPAFLNQRDRARQAELTSDVRNYALEIESWGTSNNGLYPSALATVPAPAGVGQLVTFTYVSNASTGTANDATDFCLIGTHPSITGGNHIVYQARTGGMNAFRSVVYASSSADCTLDT